VVLAAAVVIGIVAVGPALADPPTQSQTQMRAPSAEVDIQYFRRAGDQPMMYGGSITGGAAPPPSMPSITVDAGATVLFQWSFKTRHAVGATAVINYGSESITLMPGSPQPQADGWTKYENQRNVGITVAGVYTLRVSVVPGGKSDEKSIRVYVHSGALETQQPDVNATTRRVTFAVRNTGNADATGHFTVNYQIQGRDPMRPLVESSFQTESMTVAHGHHADLGHVDLSEDAWQSAQLWMRVQIGMTGPAPLTAPSHDFTYSWPAHELHVSASQLHDLGEILTGDILIHNYSNPAADIVDTIPYLTNASHINLMGQNLTFTFQRFVYSLAGVEQYFFVNNFSAPLGGRSFLDIQDGKLVMRASFDCGRSDREVKGWTRDYVFNRYVDNSTPDVDIQHFNLAISLAPTLSGGKISYRNPSLDVDSAMRFPDGWAWLNGLKGWMNDEVQDSVRSGFTDMLSRGAVKSTIEDKLTQIVMALGSTMGMHDLTSVRGSGSEIIVGYR